MKTVIQQTSDKIIQAEQNANKDKMVHCLVSKLIEDEAVLIFDKEDGLIISNRKRYNTIY
jgi:hypothetical protein